MSARMRQIGACLAVGLAVICTYPRPPVTPGRGIPRPCAAPIEVDGQLRCEGEWPQDLAAWCRAHGEERPPPTRVRVGDAIGAGRTCRRGEVGRMSPADLEALDLPVDLNEATPAELASLPGIGPALAARIERGRPYATVEAVDEVRGIGPKTLARLRPRARVEPTPVLVEWGG